MLSADLGSIWAEAISETTRALFLTPRASAGIWLWSLAAVDTILALCLAVRTWRVPQAIERPSTYKRMADLVLGGMALSALMAVVGAALAVSFDGGNVLRVSTSAAFWRE